MREIPRRLEDHESGSKRLPATNTFDGGQGEHDARLSLDVGVEHTKNVLEIGWHHQRHGGLAFYLKLPRSLDARWARNIEQMSLQSFCVLRTSLGKVTRSLRSESWRWG